MCLGPKTIAVVSSVMKKTRIEPGQSKINRFFKAMVPVPMAFLPMAL